MNELISSIALLFSIINPNNIIDNKEIVLVKISEQKMYYLKERKIVNTFDISTSKFGVGSEEGSFKTPLGKHIIKDKIGDEAPLGTVFIAREKQEKILTNLKTGNGEYDYVTTRIMRLEGLEDGKNRGIGVDSYNRYIYIHGTAEEDKLGEPASHGCIRMKNSDIIDLYPKIVTGTDVLIVE